MGYLIHTPTQTLHACGTHQKHDLEHECYLPSFPF